MAAGIYKQGQGHWVRLLSFLGGMIMFAWGAAWLAGQILRIDFPRQDDGVTYVVDPQFVQGGAGLLVLIIGLALCYWLVYAKPASAEFLISTEGEMKKVNWSSRREITGSTWVVVSIALLIAAALFVVDIGFSKFFTAIGVLNP
ncbi:MAG: preprotein translocase subunit SecE [Planctomycetota bacterium]|nr:preprotein translocase subunit SecE [Planctomycetota bacterium]